MNENAFARELRAKHGLELGGHGVTYLAPNGEPYVVLKGLGGEDEAAEAFAKYVATAPTGKVWWRVTPEVGHIKKFGSLFYMRLRLVP